MFTHLRFAVRQLAKSPSFAAVALLTLALGIAGNVVIFSIFNALYLRPLPFKEPERLVNLDEVAPKWNLEYTGLSYDDLVEWQKQNQTFDGMAAWNDASFNLGYQGQAARVKGLSVTHELFQVLGVRPLIGRVFLEEEDRPGQGNVVLLSHKIWQRQWGGDPAVLGKTVTIDAVSHTIVGVLPPNLGPLSYADLVVPAALNANGGQGWYLDGVGRLKPGASLEQARQDLTRIHKAMIPTRQVNDITSPRLTPLQERLLGDYRTATYVLMGAVGMVWVIACANVAGLMLARGLSRNREISIRLALGATRAAVVRQVLTESLLLAACGGVAGVLIGELCLNALAHSLPDQFPAWISFDVDRRFVAFYLLTTFVTAALFGLIPALKMVANASVQGALQTTSARTTGSTGQRRSLNSLVVGEIALALILLINAGLLLKAFREVQRVNAGFRAENVLTYKISLPEAKYTNLMVTTFFEEHLGQIRALPGVKAASAVSIVPFGGHSGVFFEAEGAPPKAKDAPDPVVLRLFAFPGYNEAMGLTLVSGRFLGETETQPAGRFSAVVNETFAKAAWPGQDAVGKRLRYPSPTAPWMTVIGVVRDIKHYGFDQPVRPCVFLPYHLQPGNEMTLAIRTQGDPHSLQSAIHGIVARQDPALPLFEEQTMTERVQTSLWLRRSYSWLFGLFAAIALSLCLGGIYGVISYTVSQRTSEIGIRIALGAQTWDVQRMVLQHGARLAGLGIGVGLLSSLAVAQAMRSILVGVSPTDFTIYLGVSALLGIISLFACASPTRRAAKVDPMVALRCD
ncbi:MAG TPA: ABC transporter permease [Candidatus Limnocylindria bacterium]|jgi:putative ABC transport system permease protein|nr:ABC transporter permease [Candidatus Limnocylindria bacterium]